MTRKMKDSGIEWIGEIPEEWEIHPNKRIMSKQKNICAKYCGQKVLSLTMNGVIIRDIENPSGKMPLTFDGYQYVNKGNLLMCLFDIDVTPRCIGIINNDGVTSPAYSQFKLRDIAHGKYYYYYYLNLDYTKELLHLAKNLRHSLTESQLGEIYVPLPKLKEQIRIAGYLDNKCSKIDETVQKEKQVIEKLKQYKQSVITEAVTKGLDSDVKMKDSGVEWIGEIPEHWDIICLKYLAASEKNSIVDGPFGSDMKNEEYVDEGVPIIQLNNIGEGVHKLNNLKYITEEKANGLKRHTIYPREIVIAKMMPAGRAAIVSSRFNKYIVSSDSIRLKLNSNSLNNFIVYCLNIYAKNEAEIQSTGTTRSRINLSIVKNLHLAVPCLTEQKQIADYLDKKCASIDKAILNKEKLIEKLTEYKKSLIYECVTGKREV